jgi:hypothetical protein
VPSYGLGVACQVGPWGWTAIGGATTIGTTVLAAVTDRLLPPAERHSRSPEEITETR